MDVIEAQNLMRLAVIGNGLDRQPLRWPSGTNTLRLARSAQMLGIAGEATVGAQRFGLQDLCESLALVRRGLVVNGMHRQAALLAAQRALRSESIPFLAFKGSATAQLTRQEPLLRPLSDIDVLVRPGGLVAAHEALLADGAQLLPRYPAPRESLLYATFRKYAQEVTYSYRGTHLDLHWQLGFSRHLLPSAREAISRLETVTVAGETVPTLGLRDALLHAVLHWRYGAFKQLKYVLDINGLAARVQHEGDLPRPVVSGLAMARYMISTDGPWTVARVPPGVSERDWAIALKSITNPRQQSGTYTRQRLHTVVAHARLTPSWQDRLEIPLRSSLGPIVRTYDRGADWVGRRTSP